jgi:hypothetical protein
MSSVLEKIDLAGCALLRCLQPATHRSPIGQVVRREAGLQVPLLSRDNHKRHQCHGWNESDEQPKTVDPECDAELEERERQINRIAAPTIGSSAHDRCGRTIAWNGRASGSKRAHRIEKQRDGDQHGRASERHAHDPRHKANWPHEMQQQAQDDPAQVDERGPHDPEVRDFRFRARVHSDQSVRPCQFESR